MRNKRDDFVFWQKNIALYIPLFPTNPGNQAKDKNSSHEGANTRQSNGNIYKTTFLWNIGDFFRV